MRRLGRFVILVCPCSSLMECAFFFSLSFDPWPIYTRHHWIKNRKNDAASNIHPTRREKKIMSAAAVLRSACRAFRGPSSPSPRALRRFYSSDNVSPTLNKVHIRLSWLSRHVNIVFAHYDFFFFHHRAVMISSRRLLQNACAPNSTN